MKTRVSALERQLGDRLERAIQSLSDADLEALSYGMERFSDEDIEAIISGELVPDDVPDLPDTPQVRDALRRLRERLGG